MAIKRTNTVGFVEVFRFAEKKYGISWNDCCELFHRNEVLTYKGIDEFDPEWLSELIDPECEMDDECNYDSMKVFKSITDEDVESEKDAYRKAYLIIIRFMQENNVSKLSIRND